MVLFFGLVALIAATLLSLRWRRLREFRVTPQSFDLGDGRRVDLLLRVRKHKGRYQQQIGIVGSRGLDLHAEPEDWLARAFKAIGVGRDLSCGDAHLDALLMLESDDPRSRYWLRHDSAARTGLAEVFALGAEALTAYDGRIWVSFSGRVSHLDDSPERHRAVARALQDMLANLPGTLARAHEDVGMRQARAVLLLALSTGLAVAAFSVMLTQAATRFPQQVGATGMYLGAALLLLLIGLGLWRLAAGWMGDSARARVVLAELGSVGLVGFVALGTQSVGLANLSLSSAPVVTETVAVDEVYTQRSGGARRNKGIRYYLSLPALQDGRIPATAWRIDADLYGRLQRGDQVRVRTQRGLFGVYAMTSAPEFQSRGASP